MLISARRRNVAAGADLPRGHTYPLGATVYPDGVNFCLYSKNARLVELLIFDTPDDKTPQRVIKLDPRLNRTANYWHIFVPDLKPGQLYAYRAHGPNDPQRGLRYDGQKVLLDPYARGVSCWHNYDREAAKRPGDNCAHALKGVIVDNRTYDWEDDIHPQVSYETSVIYEMHVGGFTRHESAGLAENLRGTFAGLIEKIPYLKSLGITAVELMPIQQFDEQDAPMGRTNYWGYSPVAFFAPHTGYSSAKDPLGPLNEFRDMVKALHKAGIEVILDVVFNHSAEGSEIGPTLSFRGLENGAYYILNPDDKSRYTNYSGCGNTMTANFSIMRRLIIDCLHYWVQVMHVDGFRFDLASILSRGENGEPLEAPPLLWSIDSDPILAGTKLIAEAWDAAGLYQVGSFIGERFAEWNGQFRDDIRRFYKSEPGLVGNLAARVMGSPDIYRSPTRNPNHSIHFITSHDGFTLNDLVSYNEKHNLINGEQNRDGNDCNFSWNCGVEGFTKAPRVMRLRLKQTKNLLTVLFLSQGTPMLLMGDEVRRTQHGNNNAYCHDNEISWLDWRLVKKNADLLRFTKGLINFSQSLEIFKQDQILTLGNHPTLPSLTWHGVKPNCPDWNSSSHSLAFELRHPGQAEHIYVVFNAYWEDLTFKLPPADQAWHRVIDTARRSPEDCLVAIEAPRVEADEITVEAYSAVVLIDLFKTQLNVDANQS